MYCVKVYPGSERVRVQNYSGGFLPNYKAVDADGKAAGKLFVVPGYVFMLHKAPRAIEVPDEEWKVIEAISDPHPTLADAGTGEIVIGPLKAVENLITFRTEKSVQISADLLGEKRQYWVPIRTVTEEELTAEKEAREAQKKPETPAENPEKDPADAQQGTDETGPADAGQKEENRKMNTSGARYTFTEAQRAEILRRAEEIGVRPAAKEYGIPWQTIAQYKRRARVLAEQAAGAAAVTAVKAGGKRAAGKAAGVKAAAEAVSAAEAAGDQPGAETPAEAEALKIENAVLREKIAKLEIRIGKLSKALQDLM